MKLATILILASTLFITMSAATAQPDWTIDPDHSAAHFTARHLMITNVRGDFGKMAGTVYFDGKNYATLKAHAVIDAASLNTRVPARDDHLRSPDFFDTATYPTITFTSKRVENIRGNRFNLVGDLAMRGVTREVVLEVEATPIARGMKGEPRIGAHATTRVNRQDYGIKWNQKLDAGGVAVSNEIDIILELQLIEDGK